MNSFSFNPSENSFILDNYKQWLVQDLYSRSSLTNLDDPAFLQKLSIMEADSIRKDIGAHAAATYDGIHKVGSTIDSRLKTVANLITSSLDDGFLLMNQRLLETNNNLDSIGKGVGIVNHTLKQNNILLSETRKDIGVISSEVNALNNNVVAGFKTLNAHLSQVEGMIRYQLQLISGILEAILDELKIPESQRENRYHIEQGMRFFNKGIQTGNCLYFDDALDEFTVVTNNDRKNYFSWYYLGMIHLYSKNHLDIDTALSNFDKYLYYAEALPNKHNLFDEAWIMKGECYYLKGDNDQAYLCVEKIIPYHVKASLRGMKYLSASNIEEKKQQAVEILKLLVDNNPFVIIQILEDYDLICNDYIIQFIREYKDSLQNDILQLMTILDDSFILIKAIIKSCSLINNDRIKILSSINTRFGSNESANDNEMEIKTNLESFNAINIDYLNSKKRIESKEATECVVSMLTTKNDLETIYGKLQTAIGKWKLIESSEKRHRIREKAEWLAVIKNDEEIRLKRGKQITELRQALEKIRSSNLRMNFELVDNRQSEKPFLMACRYLSMEDVMHCVSEDVFKEACCHIYYRHSYDGLRNSDKRYACRQIKRWIRDTDPFVTLFNKRNALYLIYILNQAIGIKFSLPVSEDVRFADLVINKHGLKENYWVEYRFADDDADEFEIDKTRKLLLFVTPQ